LNVRLMGVLREIGDNCGWAPLDATRARSQLLASNVRNIGELAHQVRDACRYIASETYNSLVFMSLTS
jgi:hypothetical protein